ncbi:MAG TPA: DUF4230 domain-containing protein [Pseudonocardiaceae bacterium]|jgi:hypothetical protein
MDERHPYRPWRLAVAVLAIGLVLVLAIGGVTSFVRGFNPFGSNTVDRSQPALLQSIRDLSQYHAAVGDFQVVIDVEQDVKLVPAALAGQRTLFVAVGTVNAFVDFAGMTGEALKVSQDGKSVEVRVPRAALDKPNLDPEHSYVFAQQRGAWNRLNDLVKGSDQHQFYALAEQRIAAAAEASKLRDQADQNTRTMITGMLNSLGYQVTFPDQR